MIGRVFLSQFKLRELFALQAIVAALLAFHMAAGAASSVIVLPLAITIWAAVRLQDVPIVIWINPFTIGIASTFLVGGTCFLASSVVEPWKRAFDGPEFATLPDACVLCGCYGILCGFMAIIMIAPFRKRDGS